MMQCRHVTVRVVLGPSVPTVTAQVPGRAPRLPVGPASESSQAVNAADTVAHAPGARTPVRANPASDLMGSPAVPAVGGAAKKRAE